MHVTNVIKHRIWVHKTGRRASVYGAVPYYSETDKADWSLVTNGYTFRMSDNTVRDWCQGGNEARLRAKEINAHRIQALREHAERYPETAGQCQTKIAEIPHFAPN